MLRVVALIMGLLLAVPAVAGTVLVLKLDGPIGPASREYVVDGLHAAAQHHDALVVLEMNTPGGLDSSMRDIIQAILASPVPVAGYVAPGGARAASAGTYILYASHIAAMAPATNLGAATPVQIGGLPGFGGHDRAKKKPAASNDGQAKSGAGGEQPTGSTMEHKMVNDARAYIRSLAQLRGRNAAWAEQAVSEAASLSAQEALAKHVIDVIATSLGDLLKQINGREVEINGVKSTLRLTEPTVVTLEPSWRNRLLAIITHPQVAYILMLLGIYGLFFELANPGTLIPGVSGGISLLLALFAFQVLPVNYAGLALILLGVAFMVAEGFVPSFGALGLGGVAAFVVGSLILWNGPGSYGIPLYLIAGFALASGGFFIGMGMLVARNYRRPPVTGDTGLTSRSAVVMDDFDGEGWVMVQGEAWRAKSEHALRKDEHVRIIRRKGLILLVQPKDKEITDV